MVVLTAILVVNAGSSSLKLTGTGTAWDQRNHTLGEVERRSLSGLKAGVATPRL